MSTLLIWREKLQKIYAGYSGYILKGLQFLMGLILFALINSNIGFMKIASSIVCTVGLAAVCTFFPMIVMVMAATVLILVHFYALSLPIAVVAAVIFLIMYLFPIYSKESMDRSFVSHGVWLEDTLCYPGCIRTSGNTGLDRSGSVWDYGLLYDRFCEGLGSCA